MVIQKMSFTIYSDRKLCINISVTDYNIKLLGFHAELFWMEFLRLCEELFQVEILLYLCLKIVGFSPKLFFALCKLLWSQSFNVDVLKVLEEPVVGPFMGVINLEPCFHKYFKLAPLRLDLLALKNYFLILAIDKVKINVKLISYKAAVFALRHLV